MINRKKLYTNQTSSRWKKVKQMKHFTVTTDLNGDLSFFCLFYSCICQLFNCQTLWICNGICNFNNIFSIKKPSFLLLFLM